MRSPEIPGSKDPRAYGMTGNCGMKFNPERAPPTVAKLH
jgi:hypothetical protein